MYLRLPLRAGTVFVCLGLESHSRTALYQGGRIDVRLTYSLRHPGRRRAALSFLFCSSLSMIDFYRGSRSFFPKASAKVRPFFEPTKYSGDFFQRSLLIGFVFLSTVAPLFNHLRIETSPIITKIDGSYLNPIPYIYIILYIYRLASCTTSSLSM